ncbi:MAG: leucine-rich repeat domain-containing protein [Promethearchaeota archaeon]
MNFTNNCISRISGLGALINLKVLNLNNNNISKIEGLNDY